jgi:hypothetical protein
MAKTTTGPAFVLRAAWGGAALLGLLLGAHAATAYDWEIEVVEDGKLFSEMTDRSLRLDAQGHPHIAYGEDHLYYAFHDGLTWHYEVADSSCDVGSHASLALDAAGYPHIGYYDEWNGDLKYAYRDASGWHTETVDAAGNHGTFTSLALDGSSWPHISYYDNSGPDYGLKYAYRDASGWHTETVDAAGGWHTSLALDGSAYPHISYHRYDYMNGDLKYAYRDTSGWHTETVDAAGDVGKYTSLALDGSGYPHISYCDETSGDLKYAYCDASGWHTETVDATYCMPRYTSLALGGSGYPHISYCDYTRGDLKYAYRDGSGWHAETVDAGANVGWYTSLALDGSGYPHISYYDHYPNYDLKYAYVEGDEASEEAPVSAIPAILRLLGVSPNPASTEVSVLYSLGGDTQLSPRDVTLGMYDPLGRLVGAHVAPGVSSGTHSVWWHLRSPGGELVGPGVYYLRLEADNHAGTDVRRLVVIR